MKQNEILNTECNFVDAEMLEDKRIWKRRNKRDENIFDEDATVFIFWQK